MELPESETELQEFLDLVHATHVQAEISWYLACSGITLLVYDWICTLDKEAEYLWGRRWRFARVVYHLNRILPIALIGAVLIPNILFAPPQFSDLMCKNMILLYSYGAIALLGIIATTSILRCWTLYNQNWIIWILVPALIITLAQGAVSVTFAAEKLEYTSNPVTDILRGCMVSLSEKTWLAYFAGMFNEVLIFGLLVGRVLYLSKGLGMTPLMKQLLKNGTVFFAVNLGLMLLSCIGSAYSSTVVVANSSGLLIALSSIMCSRIFFSLHDFIEDRTYTESGLAPASSLRINSSNISGQFIIPMQTFDAGGSLFGTRLDVSSPPPTLGRSISTGKTSTRGYVKSPA